MNEHDIVLRCFWAAFFVVFGVFMMTRGRNFLAACTADCFLKVDSPEQRQRLEAAVERRVEAEGKPVPLGFWEGWLSIGLAALAATGLVQPELLYASLCFGMALGVAAVFLRLRNSQPKRVAILAARNPESVMPAYWFAIALISVLSLLTYVTTEGYRGPALLVMASSLLSIGFAWKLTALPALLTGVDVEAEQVIDDRLRFYRTRAAMMFAVAQTFVLCTSAGNLTPAQTVSYVLTAVACVAFTFWMIRRQFAAVRVA